MQNFMEPSWHRAMYEPLLESLENAMCYFPNHFKHRVDHTLLAFHKLKQKWRHYNPLRSLGARKEERCVDIAHDIVNVVEGWLQYMRPRAQAFLQSGTILTLAKQKDEPPTPILESTNEERTLNWIL
ncbi:hypothetical protein L3X38_032644 [Prunus dulcis]|uniref:Uncharacterized protein n=1 Tax=Prunus dulcis TaxID=3755 RepID=A0AAD4YV52_PRUDU|nr:hypothetical protein L3X38_032644 [Prunus dulcis]